MKPITELLTTEQLKKDFAQYKIINPLLFARKLNKLLRSERVRREVHRACLAFDAVKRWECLENYNFDRYVEPRRPLKDEKYLLPWQVVTMDWDCFLPPGRRPNYHQFVMAAGCHWRAGYDLMLARELMPEHDWVVVSAEKHTMVMAPEAQLIWDMSFYAMGVDAQSALEQTFGEDLDNTDYDLYEDDFSFSLYTIELINILDTIDNSSKDKVQLIKDVKLIMDGVDPDELAVQRELVAA
ncbi:hypothetical protein SynBIOSE41_00850 [Synechococcus sp. BIOS-E4-1]|uniref:hypothetical protein n=1 Tax=Synechococcus sp. BIOS-E4-1 TaxID=1400864 RepID=UPI0016459978|nr:hypothetical protein [Synechococcus sp. BIOS-E4-1]QNI53382.1 hypothetical protein SynBIOSE41_00850 [Synechococcus sp. BIOS-E4-1]